MAKFTAFCRHVSGRGTTWIDTVEAADQDAAIIEAEKACASAWDYSVDRVQCIGLAAGDVTILFWED